jgi:alkaline phosphatase D
LKIEEIRMKNRLWRSAFITLFLGMITGSYIAVETAEAAYMTHGPVVGGVSAKKAKVFLRTNESASVKIQYGTDTDLLNSLMTVTFQTSSKKDFTRIIPLSGLIPKTTYYLNVYVDGVPQISPPYPSFKTFPATTDPKRFKFIILTDFKNQRKATETFPIFLNASDEGAVFTFISGDFDHRDPQTLFEKRRMFKDLYDPNSLGLTDFVNGILRQMPIVHHWDDHDAGGNNIDKTYPYWNRSYRVFQEYVPTYSLPLLNHGIWQKFTYAQVDFFVLDNRSQRDPNVDPDDENKSMLDGDNLGPDGQLEWLKQGLLNSTAKWKIIFSSVVTNPTTKHSDSWGGFQTEWTNLTNFIQDNGIGGIVFISGDLHIGGIDNGNASGFPEMVVPPPNFPESCGTGSSPGNWRRVHITIARDPAMVMGL